MRVDQGEAFSAVDNEVAEVFFDMSADMFAVTSLDGTIQKANASFGRALRCDERRLAGRNLESLVAIEDRHEVRQFIEAMATGGEAEVLLRLTRPDGAERRVRCMGRGIPILDALYVTGRDVTSEYELAAELRRSNRDLEQFAYLASHDLQSPLRTVRGFMDLLIARIQENGGTMDEEADRYASLVDSAVDRMEKLIRGLLTFSRVETRAGDRTLVDLQRLCEQVVMAIADIVENTDAKVNIIGLPTVVVDPDQLSSVLQNLIQNAIKYRHPDRTPAVDVSATGWGAWWTISVRDNGIGIDPKLTDKAFQMFKQLHPEGKYEGIGFGLSLARRIIEHHGGSMTLESDGETGTTVSFTLPAAELGTES